MVRVGVRVGVAVSEGVGKGGVRMGEGVGVSRRGVEDGAIVGEGRGGRGVEIAGVREGIAGGAGVAVAGWGEPKGRGQPPLQARIASHSTITAPLKSTPVSEGGRKRRK
jgi:hypothetical protein